MNPAERYLRSLSPASRKSQEYSLRRVLVALDMDRESVVTFDWCKVRVEHVLLVKSRIGWMLPSTVRLTMMALRKVMKECGLPETELQQILDEMR